MSVSDSAVLRISEEKTLELVELYKKEECLWNTSSPDYRIKIKRRESAEKIARELDLPNFEARHVMMKFRNLRNAYCQELKRTAIYYNNLTLDEDTNTTRKIKPKAQWYTVLDSFIRPHLQMNHSHSGPTLVINGGIIKREPEPEPEEDPDELWDNTDSVDQTDLIVPDTYEACSRTEDISDTENNKRPPSSSKNNSPKRFKSQDILAESLQEVSTQLAVLNNDIASNVRRTQENGDYHDSFGKYVASLLRLLPKRKALMLQPKIVNMIATEVLQEQDENDD